MDNQTIANRKKHISIIFSLITTISLNYFLTLSTGNLLNIVIFGGIYNLYNKIGFDASKRLQICSFVGSGIFAFVLTAGRYSRTNETIINSLMRYRESVTKDEFSTVILDGYNTWADILMIGIMLVGLWVFIYFIYLLFMKYITEKNVDFIIDKKRPLHTSQIFWKSFFVILLCWMPYFILNYPGVLTFDSINQLSQIEEIDILNNRHPVIHTLLISICYKAGNIISENANTGVAFYSLIQMGIMSSIYSCLINTLYLYGLKRRYCNLIILYFSIVPFNAMYAITMWKDILFAGFVLWYSINIFRIFIGKEKKTCIILSFLVSGTLMTLFRSNGLIVYLMCIPFFILAAKRWRKKIIILLLIPLSINVIVTGPIYDLLKIEKGNIVESLCMPLQHISRVVVDCGDSLSEYEIEKIEKIAPVDKIRKTYNCRFADPIKNLIWSENSDQIIQDHLVDFFILWFRLGIKHPLEYIKAELDATLGYWYPDVQYFVISTGVYPNDFGICSLYMSDDKIFKTANQWFDLYRYTPVLGNLYSMGTIFLIIIFILTSEIYLKKYIYALVSIPVLMVWFTIMMATPLHSEMRYVYSMMVTVPLIIVSFFLCINRNNIDRNWNVRNEKFY